MSAPLSPRPATESHSPFGDEPVTQPRFSDEEVAAAAPIAAAEAKQERHFESNLGRLFSRQAGESKERAWTIAILSSVLVLPVVLTAIVDLGRGLGFLIGNQSAAAAKYFDGKSWSLIDRVSEGCQAIARKAQALYVSHTTVDPTQATLNTIDKQVAKLVHGYRECAGSVRHIFKGADLQEGEQEIHNAQKALVQAAMNYAERGGAEGFGDALNAIKEVIQKGIEKEAGNDFYVGYHIARNLPLRALAEEAFSEFLLVLNPAVSEQFGNLAEKGDDVAQRVKYGVDQGLLTSEQARVIQVKQLASAAALQIAHTGSVDEQEELIKTKITDCALQYIKEGKLDATDQSLFAVKTLEAMPAAQQIAEQSRQEQVRQLAVDAAVRVSKEDVVDAEERFCEIAGALIKEGKLLGKDQDLFVELALEQVEQARQAAQAAERQAEAAEAARVLYSKFGNYFQMISKKQEGLAALFGQHEALDAERKAITDELDTLRKTEVSMISNGKVEKMNVFDATKLYQNEQVKISNRKIKPAVKLGLLKKLANNDNRTVELIGQLNRESERLTAKMREMEALSQLIDQRHDELVQIVSRYNGFVEDHQKQSAKNTHQTIKVFKKTINARQEELNTRYNELQFTPAIERVKAFVSPPANIRGFDNDAALETMWSSLQSPAPAEETQPSPIETKEPVVRAEMPKSTGLWGNLRRKIFG